MRSCEHLLIDGKNAIYRAIFAGYGDPAFKATGYDYFVIMVRFIGSYISLFNPHNVHIFWDGPRDKIWRKAIIQEYKEHRAEKYKDLEIDIHSELKRQVGLSIVAFKYLNCRQYYREGMEADDLIYSFCTLNRESTVIISSDQDFRQISYKMDHVHIYNPLSKEPQVEPKPDVDVVIVKSLMGDKSDNIIGYYNIGPVKSTEMAKDKPKMQEFLRSNKAIVMVDGEPKVVGDSLFMRNRRIIDLSWCPHIADNCEYVEYKQQTMIILDQKKVENMANQNRVRGLPSDLPRYIPQFMALASPRHTGQCD
jgi:5'-3' exonuclease